MSHFQWIEIPDFFLLMRNHPELTTKQPQPFFKLLKIFKQVPYFIISYMLFQNLCSSSAAEATIYP